MKMRIIGPQNTLRMAPDQDFHFLGIDLDLPDVPKEGQSIVLDGGSVYVVTDVTWFIDTEAGDNDALAEKKDTPGRLDLIHVAVKPKEAMGTTYGNDFQMAEAARRLFDLLIDDRNGKKSKEARALQDRAIEQERRDVSREG